MRGKGDDGVPTRNGRKDHREQAKKRGFLGGENANDSHRLHDGEIKMRRGNRIHAAEEGFEFVGPSGVVGDAINGGANFAQRGLAVRLGRGNGIGHFPASRLEHLSEAVEDLATIVGAAFGPPRSRFGSRFDSIAEILAGAERDIAGEDPGGVAVFVNPSTLGANERPADEAFRGFGNGQTSHGSRTKSLTTEDTESTEREEEDMEKAFSVFSPCPPCSPW